MTRHRYAGESARCAGAKPNALLRSSAGAGWTALLLDRHEGHGHSDIFETHPTPDLTLVVATRGEHRIAVSKRGHWRSAVYQQGAIGLTPPHETTRMRWSSIRDPFRTVHLYLPHDLIADVADEYRRVGAPPATQSSLSSLVFRDPAVAACATTLAQALEAGAPDLYAEQAGRWLAAHLLSRHAGWRHDADGEREPAIITDRRLGRVLEFMSAHLDRPLTLDRLAREAGISVHHFGRRFRERMGATPYAYLTALRMDTARRLLRTTERPVADIALACGYTRPAAFAAAFLHHVGATPSAYRARSSPARD